MKLLRLPANYLQGHLLAKEFLEKVAKTTKKPPKTHVSGGYFGDPPEIRTPDPLLKRQLLCQLS